MNIKFDPDIQSIIDDLLEQAKKERHIHSRSVEVLKDIASLWDLDEIAQYRLAKIASSYIISSFLLKSLARINKRFDKDSQSFKEWIEGTYLARCMDILEYDDAYTLEDVSRIGNLADSCDSIAEEYDKIEDGEIWVFDSIFQFADSLGTGGKK